MINHIKFLKQLHRIQSNIYHISSLSK